MLCEPLFYHIFGGSWEALWFPWLPWLSWLPPKRIFFNSFFQCQNNFFGLSWRVLASLVWRVLVFRGSGWSSCDCEKSLSRPAHCNTSCDPPRSPPGCARDDGAPDHQGYDCGVNKNNTNISCLVFYTCHSVWKRILLSIFVYMCLCVINTFLCTYLYMYTSFIRLCHKQVHICTCVNIIISSTIHTYELTFNDKHISYKLMILERPKSCKKMPKKSRKVAVQCASTSQPKNSRFRIYASSGPAGLMTSLRWWLTLIFGCELWVLSFI